MRRTDRTISVKTGSHKSNTKELICRDRDAATTVTEFKSHHHLRQIDEYYRTVNFSGTPHTIRLVQLQTAVSSNRVDRLRSFFYWRVGKLQTLDFQTGEYIASMSAGWDMRGTVDSCF